jgi:maltose O-acetyltransferase
MLLERSSHERLEVGPRTRFYVPVRSAGCGTLVIGPRNSFGYGPAVRVGNGEILLQPRSKEARILIGRGNAFSNNVSVVASGEITIGDGCQIGDQVAIYDCDFHEIDPERRNRGVGPIRPVHIGNNVWLGSRVIVLKGVTIGDNTVVGAMSLVTQSLPANCVAAGNPARVIRLIPQAPANP